MNIDLARFNMVEQQIRPGEVSDPNLLALLLELKREEFVLEPYRDLAFSDIRLPLCGGGKALFPRIEAKMVNELNLSSKDNVLQIGVNNGYIAALIASIANKVKVIDCNLDDLAWGRSCATKHDIFNIEFVQHDLNVLSFANEYFDKIIVVGSLTISPEILLPTLKRGGKLIGFIGQSPLMSLIAINKSGIGEISKHSILETDVDYLIKKSAHVLFEL